MKKKNVKAWAIVLKETSEIQTAGYFADVECPAAYCPPSIAIFETRKEAEYEKVNCLNPEAQQIVPCIITYPKSK